MQQKLANASTQTTRNRTTGIDNHATRDAEQHIAHLDGSDKMSISYLGKFQFGCILPMALWGALCDVGVVGSLFGWLTKRLVGNLGWLVALVG